MSEYNIVIKNKTKNEVLIELEKFAYQLGYSEININERVGNITYKKENRGFRSLIVTINLVEVLDDIKLVFNFPNKSDLGLSKNRFMKKSFDEIVTLINYTEEDNNQINEKIEVLKSEREKDGKKQQYKMIAIMVGVVVVVWIIYEIYTYVQLQNYYELKYGN